MLLGSIYDVNKNYILGFIILICIALTGALIVSFLPKHIGVKEIINN